MPEYLQSERFFYLTTPLGADQILLKGFTGQEGLSQLFQFQLECVAENATTVDFHKLIGQKVSWGVVGDPQQGHVTRHFNGIVSHMSQGSRDKFFTDFNLVIVPDIWKLTQKIRSRIFQHITIPDILKKVLTGFDVAYEIQGTWEQREYCIQHQESDFDFLCRLMEEEGIFYFFKFTEGVNKLVLANTPQSHSDIPGDSKLIFEGVQGGNREEERVSSWEKVQFLRSGKTTLWDHQFQLPHRKLDATQTVIDSVAVGKVTHKLKLAGNEDFEVYENPGGYAHRFDGIDKSGGEKSGDLDKISQDNKRTAGIRMQQLETPMLHINAVSNVRHITAGHKFTLQRHFNADGVYVITQVSHTAREASIRSESSSGEENHYSNIFSCIPHALPFRPPRLTQCPYIPGSQSGVVVGPAGEEIFTDKYGRVKVQFHWDRDGKNDADSSCWLRVAHMWAGQTWGAMTIPRIGQEVIIMFLEGHPDKPIIVGSVYNPNQMPPYELPKHKTVSSWKSRSSKGGTKNNFNELRYEDLKGKEQVFLHGERDKDERVKAESREFVGGNRHLIVKKNQKEKIEQSRHTKILQDDILQVGGSRKTSVDGSIELKIAGSNQQKSGGKFAYEAGSEIHIKAGTKVIIEAGAQITLKGPGGFIDISAMGVVIQGTLVLINSGGAAGSGSGSNPNPPDPEAPDQADDGTKFDKL